MLHGGRWLTAVDIGSSSSSSGSGFIMPPARLSLDGRVQALASGGGGGDGDAGQLAPLETTALAAAALNLEGLSYEEYFRRIDEMIDELKQQWKQEQRVKSLKIAIQLSKLLADTSQLKLYSKKYKMVADSLDEFGRLVYRRIHSLADNDEGGANNQQDHQDDHSDEWSSRERAKDTCRNWFLKVASIRELVPRFYTELAILGACDILLGRKRTHRAARAGVGSISDEQLFAQSLARLTKSAWGLGDPIVAIHGRAYLCRVAARLIRFECQQENQLEGGGASMGALFELVRANLKASIVVVGQLEAAIVLRALQSQHVDLWTFFELVSGALQAISNTIAHKDELYTNEDRLSASAMHLFETMLSDSIELIKGGGGGGGGHCRVSVLASNIILHSIIRSMPASVIVKHHQSLLELIRHSYESELESFKEQPIGQATATSNSNYDNDNHSSLLATFYPTLESFALALDASSDFEIRGGSSSRPASGDQILVFARRLLDDQQVAAAAAADGGDGLRPQYLRCFKAWLSYANHYHEPAEVDTFLAEFIERLRQSGQQQQQQLNSSLVLDLIRALISSRRTVLEFKQLLAMKSFQSLLELLRRDATKLEACRLILETMRIELKLSTSSSSSSSSSAKDAIEFCDKSMINLMIRLFASVNDCLALLAADDDIEQLSQLIILFIKRVRLADHADQLELLCKCRAALSNLNPIVEFLAREALALAKLTFAASSSSSSSNLETKSPTATAAAATARKRRKPLRNHLNGCLAFAFVTIPAIDSQLTRVELFMRGSELALDQMSLSLADYYLRQALSNLGELLSPVALATPPAEPQAAPTDLSPLEPSIGQRDRRGRRRQRRISAFDEPEVKPETPPLEKMPPKAGSRSGGGGGSNISSRQLAELVRSMLDSMLKHQDFIDLRHKLALADLIAQSAPLSGCTDLIEQSNYLKIVTDQCEPSNPDAT